MTGRLISLTRFPFLMAIIRSQPDAIAHAPDGEDTGWTVPDNLDTRKRASAPGQMQTPTVLRQEKAFADAMANSAGLGNSAEEATFVHSERVEAEAHDVSREAGDSLEKRIEEVIRIDAIKAVLRLLDGEHASMAIKGRAERFASHWFRGKFDEAMVLVNGEATDPDRMELLKRLLDRDREHVDEGMRLDAISGQAEEPYSQALVTKLMDRMVSESVAGTAAAGASGSTARTLMQSTPSVKLVFEAAAGTGEDELRRMAETVLRGRVDTRLSQGAEVYLSLTLLRLIQQVRQVERVAARMKAARNG